MENNDHIWGYNCLGGIHLHFNRRRPSYPQLLWCITKIPGRVLNKPTRWCPQSLAKSVFIFDWSGFWVDSNHDRYIYIYWCILYLCRLYGWMGYDWWGSTFSTQPTNITFWTSIPASFCRMLPVAASRYCKRSSSRATALDCPVRIQT